MRYLILLIVLLVGCGVNQEETPIVKSSSLVKVEYKEPTLDMGYVEFSRLCDFGQSSEDRVSRNKTSTYDVIIVRLGDTRQRLSSGCYGTFVFRNGRLVSIRN